MTELPAGLTDEEKNWSYAAHLGPLLLLLVSGGSGSFLVPLFVWMAKKDESPTITQHAKASLNFQLTMLIAVFAVALMAIGTLGLGMILAIPLFIFITIVMIYGGVKACMQVGRGEPASYPFSIELIK
jgi:uncharacterized Tic20 family protein